MHAIIPIHTDTINGQPVRFYKQIVPGAGAALWHSIDDLDAALGVARSCRAVCPNEAGTDLAAYARMKRQAIDATSVAPNWRLNAMIDHLARISHLPADTLARYREAASVAMKRMIASLPVELTEGDVVTAN